MKRPQAIARYPVYGITELEISLKVSGEIPGRALFKPGLLPKKFLQIRIKGFLLSLL